MSCTPYDRFIFSSVDFHIFFSPVWIEYRNAITWMLNFAFNFQINIESNIKLISRACEFLKKKKKLTNEMWSVFIERQVSELKVIEREEYFSSKKKIISYKKKIFCDRNRIHEFWIYYNVP